jgi:hypothetical protein
LILGQPIEKIKELLEPRKAGDAPAASGAEKPEGKKEEGKEGKKMSDG